MSDAVLIVDASVSMRYMISMILKGDGYQAIEAENGEQALEQLTDGVNAVITDHNMPVMNGAELTRSTRAGNVR